jgi:inosose dehydratase
MLVGTASVNWGFDPLYDWTERPTFDHLLDEMAASGYAGTEISYHFPTDVEELRRDLASRNLLAASTFHEVDLLDPAQRQAELERAMPVVERLQALGSDTLIVSDHTRPDRLAVAGRVQPEHGLSDAQWRALADGLDRLGEALRARGMKLVIHPHVGTYVETREEIDRLFGLADPALLGMCPDTGHLAYAGADPEAVFADYADRIWYVHLKDTDARKLEQVRKEGLNFVEAVRLGTFVPLGEGSVDLARIFGALQKAGYGGWIIVEQDAPREPFAAAVQSRQYLREHFGI